VGRIGKAGEVRGTGNDWRVGKCEAQAVQEPAEKASHKELRRGFAEQGDNRDAISDDRRVVHPLCGE